MRRIALPSVALVIALAALACFVWLFAHDGSALRPEPAQIGGNPGEAVGLANPDDSVHSSASEGAAAREVVASLDDEIARSRAAADSTPARVTGRVVDVDGHPVAGARVLTADGESLLVPLDAREHDDRGRTECATAADGRFELARGRIRTLGIAVRAPGFAPLDVERTLPISGDCELGELRLARGVRLSGRVLGPDGRGVAEAELVRLDSNRAHIYNGGTQQHGAVLARTDSEGDFEIATLAPGPWSFRIHSATHVDAEFRGWAEAGTAESGLAFVLQRGATIAGRVVPPSGVDPRQFTVRARPYGQHSIQVGDESGIFREASCDEQGSFALGGLADAPSFRVAAYSGSGAHRLRLASEWVATLPGASNVVLDALAPVELRFRVVDAANEQPLAEFEIGIVDEDGDSLWTEAAGDGGRLPHEEGTDTWRLSWQPDPRRKSARFARVAAKGCELLEREFALDGIGRADLGTFLVRRLPTFAVHVVDAVSEQPIENASVELDDRHDVGFAPVTGSATTDARGIARLPRHEGRALLLTASHGDYLDCEGLEITLDSGSSYEPILRLERGIEVEAILVDVRGLPVAGRPIVGTRLPKGGVVGTSGATQTTDAQGRALFRGLPRGPWRFRVREPMHLGLLSSHSHRDEDEPGDAADLSLEENRREQVHLVAVERGCVECRATESGRALAGAEVYLFPKVVRPVVEYPFWRGQATAHATSDGLGRFAFDSLLPGAYTLWIDSASRAMPEAFDLDVRAGLNQIECDLATTSVTGRVLDERGRPLPSVEVRACSYANRPPEVSGSSVTMAKGETTIYVMSAAPLLRAPLTDEAGRYVLRGVSFDSEVYICAEAPMRQYVASKKLRLARDEQLDGVDLVLEPAGVLEVVMTQSGKPSTNAEIALACDEPLSRMRSARTDWAGFGRVMGLSPGSWRLRVVIDDTDVSAVARTVEIRAGEVTSVEISIP